MCSTAPAGISASPRLTWTAKPGMTLFLQADDAARYGTVAKVMAVIERAGIDKLAVITKAE